VKTVGIKQRPGLCTSNVFRTICPNAKVFLSGALAFPAFLRALTHSHAERSGSRTVERALHSRSCGGASPILRASPGSRKGHGFRGFSTARSPWSGGNGPAQGFAKVVELGQCCIANHRATLRPLLFGG
jgi:hypothetical protein